jgi:hypothetical protein
MKITPRRQLGVELQKSAKIGHFYWRPTNSIGAQSKISYSIVLENFLVRGLLAEMLIAFLLVRSLNVSIEELCTCLNDNRAWPHFPDWGCLTG